MAPYLVEVRNHTRKQILVVALPSRLAPLERVSRLHAKDTPGWDYQLDDIEFVELAVVTPSKSTTTFVKAYVKARKIPSWRILAAASLRVEHARQTALRSRARRGGASQVAAGR